MSAWLRGATRVLPALALAGCGLLLDPGPPRPDAAETRDAGRGIDAGLGDAGDAMTSLDTGLAPDIGLDIDAGSDASVLDMDGAIDARPTTVVDAHVARDAPDADARDAPDGDARDAADGDAPDGDVGDAAERDARGFDARAIDTSPARPDAFCTSSGECDLLTQCGCTAAEACQFGRPPDFSPVCVAPGSVARGGLCMTESECGRGLTCTYLGDPPGVCTQFCMPGSACDSGALCLPLGPVSAPLPVGACSPNCNPLMTGSCPGGLVCDVANDPSSFSYCRVVGAGTVGSPCTRSTDCPARTTCVGSVCRALCASGFPCGAGTCAPFAPPVSVGGFPVGYCAG